MTNQFTLESQVKELREEKAALLEAAQWAEQVLKDLHAEGIEYDFSILTSAIASAASQPQEQVAPTEFDAEFLSKRLARVAKIAGVSMPENFNHEQVCEVAGTILGQIAAALGKPQEQSAPTIFEFAMEHGLDVVVRSRKDFRSLGAADFFYTRIDNAEINEGGFLRGAFGNGATPAEANRNYAKEISGQTLVIDAGKATRREIRVPVLDLSFPHEPVTAQADLAAKVAELEDQLNEMADAFGVGSEARKLRFALVENAKNAARRSRCLSMVESKFFTTTIEGDEGESIEECMLNWGDDPDQYLERFSEALAVIENARFTAAESTIAAQAEQIRVAREALDTAVKAIIIFRNEPSLARLHNLRATDGYAAMQQAMDIGREALSKLGGAA